jgi:hypothetical protein
MLASRKRNAEAVIRYVIDASALVKLVVPEDDSDKMPILAALHR